MTVLLEPAIRDWDFPRAITGVTVLVEHGRAHGIVPRSLLAGTGLRVADLGDDREVTAGQELRVVRNLLRLGSGQAVSAVVLGRRYRLETFGIAGYALATSPTLLDAMNFALQFMDLTFTFSIPHARLDGEDVVIEAFDETLPDDVRGFLAERDLAAVEAVLRELFLDALPTRFDRSAASIRFPATYLGAVLPQSNPAVLALATELCADLAGRRRGESTLVQQVRILLAQRLSFDASAAGVAQALAVGERTLRRRLAAEGASFQRLLDEVRIALAAQLLGTGSLSVAEVAQRLGYSESAAFIHAHRRWHGATPGQVS